MNASEATIRIRLLDDLEVVRADGSVVDPSSWNTTKTMDLLRLLALHNGLLVRAAELIDLLWPDAEPSRARGSLRTAASNIRRTVGCDCIERRHGDLVLVSATVDVDDYRGLVLDVGHAAARRDHELVLRLTRAAESLYRGDFRASNDTHPWAVRARAELVRLRFTMLVQATESALAQRRFPDALDLARTASRVDPSSESALRNLMRAHAELGEVPQALRAFEQYRSHLADELGIDPARPTRDLHLRLLQDPAL